MPKFLKLVANEYIKIFSKVSSWILIALCLIAFFLINLLMYVDRSMSQKYMNDQDYIYMYQNQLDNANAMGNKQEAEKYTYLIEHNIKENNWKYEAVLQLYQLKAQAATASNAEELTVQIKAIEDLLANEDWRAFYLLKVDYYTKLLNDNPTAQIELDEAKYRLEKEIPLDGDDNKSVLIMNLFQEKKNLALYQASERPSSADLARGEEQVLKYQYMLDHNIDSTIQGQNSYSSNEQPGLWYSLTNTPPVVTVIAFLIVILAGVSVASEFSKGTVKLLLTNPVKRSKIFLSKYAALLSLSVILVAAAYLVSILSALLFFGTKDIGSVYLTVSGGKVHALSGFVYLAGKFTLASVNVFVFGTMAFMLSTLMRSSALSIGLSVFLLLAGSLAVLFFQEVLHAEWARYILFANTDRLINGTSGFYDHTLSFALVNIGVYMVVFFLTAWDAFMRRDIK